MALGFETGETGVRIQYDGIVTQLGALASGQSLELRPTARKRRGRLHPVTFCRAFLSCDVKETAGKMIAGWTPAVLSQIARELIRRGQVSVSPGGGRRRGPADPGGIVGHSRRLAP